MGPSFPSCSHLTGMRLFLFVNDLFKLRRALWALLVLIITPSVSHFSSLGLGDAVNIVGRDKSVFRWMLSSNVYVTALAKCWLTPGLSYKQVWRIETQEISPPIQDKLCKLSLLPHRSVNEKRIDCNGRFQTIEGTLHQTAKNWTRVNREHFQTQRFGVLVAFFRVQCLKISSM